MPLLPLQQKLTPALVLLLRVRSQLRISQTKDYVGTRSIGAHGAGESVGSSRGAARRSEGSVGSRNTRPTSQSQYSPSSWRRRCLRRKRRPLPRHHRHPRPVFSVSLQRDSLVRLVRIFRDVFPFCVDFGFWLHFALDRISSHLSFQCM
jgi:hypothetical protein